MVCALPLVDATHRVVGGLVVHDHHFVGDTCLPRQRVEQTGDVGRFVPTRDHHGDRHWILSPTSSPTGIAASNGVSMTPFGPAESTHPWPTSRHCPHASGSRWEMGVGSTTVSDNHWVCTAPAPTAPDSGKRPGPHRTLSPTCACAPATAACTRPDVTAIRRELSHHAPAGGSTAVANTASTTARTTCEPCTVERAAPCAIVIAPSIPTCVRPSAPESSRQTRTTGGARSRGRIPASAWRHLPSRRIRC